MGQGELFAILVDDQVSRPALAQECEDQVFKRFSGTGGFQCLQ